jgi:pimeloyl-ACP methyl ester carboxylesterase
MSGTTDEREPLLDIERPGVDRQIPDGPVPLHYLDWGGDGPDVLFVHGAGLNAHTWDHVCVQLRDEFRCVAVDLRGHGDSGWSDQEAYDLTDYAADIAVVRQALALRRLVLVGMSLGGVAALTYAGTAADPLDGLVLVEAGPEPRSDGRKRLREFMSEPPELESVEAFVDRAMAFNPLRRPEVLRRSLLNNLRQTASGSWTWKYDPRQMSRARIEDRVRRLPELWSTVSRLTCPTLVVRGGDSDVFHDEDAEKLAATFPDGRWVRVEGARHTVQGDRPIALATALRPFLREVTTRD